MALALVLAMILYEGPSLLDSSVEVVVIATEDSNPKTGRMLFTWILRQDRPPEVAAYDGSDDAICGDCKFRAQLDSRGWDPEWDASVQAPPFMQKSRTCYVRLSPAEGADETMPPSEVWRAWKAGKFYGGPQIVSGMRDPNTDECIWEQVLEGNTYWQYRGPLPVRIGSYGDPAAVPTRVWAALVRYAKHWTGYTHFCRTCDPDLKRYCMASVDTPEERAEAQALGWRTFMVVPENRKEVMWNGTARAETVDMTVGGTDILCPATDPHPKRNATCSTCLLCRGTSAPAPSIWEISHGKNASNHTW